ncbi:M20 family metallopeptidase [Radiobacillus sp. PE A8.2]|uniref:M20 family metallopeptidase n=1 Tax=Radiobacillus sp. PE A8.2 TaxID=3380349 RepID=UPI00388ED4A9
MVNLLNYLKEHQQQMEDTLLRLVEAESPSNDKKLVDQCGVVLQKQFEQLISGQVDVIEKDEVGNQYRFTYGTGSEQILILGHYDTVWDQGALPIRKQDGKLYGPGVFDMKGGLTVTLWAMKTLKEAGIVGNRKVVFLVTSDEEIGSHHSHELIKQEAKKSAMVIVPESSISPKGAVKTQRKGIGLFQLQVRGVPVHAGINPWDGASAIDELALQIADFKKLDDREKGISINIGTISGGTRKNVVAAYAEADIDVRFETKEQAEMLEEALLNRPTFNERTTVEMLGGINRYPLERSESVFDLYLQLKEIAASHGYELEEGASGGGSDGNFTAGVGIPTIDGLGPVGDGAHAEHEHVELENLAYRAALIAELIKRNMD